MILGVGTDIIECARIKRSIERQGQRFLDRLFTPAEQAYCEQFSNKHQRYAGRFAAKEAIAKALGTGFGEELSWLDIEILNNETGKPIARFREHQVQISISHCEDYATAVAILCD